MPETTQPIKVYNLNERYFYIHKKGFADTGFGMDHDYRLLDNGFGLYSGTNLQKEIGPLRSDFYRIALCLSGTLTVAIGLETFYHRKNTIHFNTPNRLFAFTDKSEDHASYYLFFTANFINELLKEAELEQLYPFFSYLNTPFFELSEEESQQIQYLFRQMSGELHASLPDASRSIKLLTNLMLIAAKRSYLRQALPTKTEHVAEAELVTRYKKMVARHFATRRTVKEYAAQLAVTASHLSKTVKQVTGRKAIELIDEMLIMEIKALLRYSELNASEIAYQLLFTDTSHLAKFFKRYTGTTPLAYRKSYR